MNRQLLQLAVESGLRAAPKDATLEAVAGAIVSQIEFALKIQMATSSEIQTVAAGESKIATMSVPQPARDVMVPQSEKGAMQDSSSSLAEFSERIMRPSAVPPVDIGEDWDRDYTDEGERRVERDARLAKIQAELARATPSTLEVSIPGSRGPLTLRRKIEKNPVAECVKITYTPADIPDRISTGRAVGTSFSGNSDNREFQTGVNVSASVLAGDSEAFNPEAIMSKLKDQAVGVFMPRPKSIEPMIPPPPSFHLDPRDMDSGLAAEAGPV